jgi:putative copper resistance protein D
MDNFLFLPRAFASGLFDIAFAAAVGSLLALLWQGSATPNCSGSAAGFLPVAARLRRTLTICALAMAVLLMLQLWLVTATMLGSSSFQDVRGQLLEVLSGTHAGRILVPQFCLALLLAVAAVRQTVQRRAGIVVGLLLLGVWAGVRAASGHAASQGDFTFAVALQFLHLASIAVWAGGILISGLIVLPGILRHQELDTGVPEISRCAGCISRTSTWAVFVVITTGLWKGWTGLGRSFRPLEHTQWGILLTVKSALVMVALALGVKNRLHMSRNPVFLEADARSFSGWVQAEAVVMVAILVLSGFLANSPPAIDT